MIWMLIDILANPSDYAITWRNGELYIERIEALKALDYRVK